MEGPQYQWPQGRTPNGVVFARLVDKQLHLGTNVAMANRGEVAIIGYAGRLPGAANADAFWSLMRDGRSSVGWITPYRFPTHGFYHPSMEQRGRAYTFAAGLIDDVWGFAAGAFGMSPREAEQVDPQQRHL